MNSQTRLALNAINRDFYAAEASSSEFSATRDHAWPGWERLWDAVRAIPRSRGPTPERASAPRRLSVLDAGCGNGRFAAFLAAQERETIDYTGVDASQPLLEIAAARAKPLASARFLCSDFVAGTSQGLGELEPSELRFDVVVLIGVLHHIPSFETRAQLLATLAERLRPGGILGFTLWRFAEPSLWPRFQTRALPWQDYNRSSANPLDLSQLEAGDHLLRWGDGLPTEGHAAIGPLRYCHYVDASERDALLESLPLEVIDHYTEDGRSNDLNEYVLLQRKT